MSSSGDTAERDVSDRLVRDRSSRIVLPQTRRPQTPGGPKHREAPNTGRPQTPGGPKHREATHEATIMASLAKLLAPRMRQNTPTRPRLRLCEGRRISL